MAAIAVKGDSATVGEAIRLVNIRAVSALLSCCPNHIRNMVGRGEFPQPVRLGHLLRWRLEEIEAWVKSRQSSAGAA